MEFEDERRLPSRQKLWNWIVHLVDEVPIYDIFALFKRLVEVLKQITICSVDDELELVIKMDYNPSKQNVFSYLGDLRKAIKRLHDVCERLPVDGRINLPDSYVKSRLVRAARQVPVYRPVIEALLISPMKKWAKLTSDDLYHQLEAVCANELSVYATPGVIAHESGVKANKAPTKPKNEDKDKEKSKTPGVCFKFGKGQACANNPCPYSHDAPSARQNQSSERKTNVKCTKCLGAHMPRKCT